MRYLTIYKEIISIYLLQFYKTILLRITLDYTGPTAFVLGNETDGLSFFWKNKSMNKIMIPMQGKIDSMNISVSQVF